MFLFNLGPFVSSKLSAQQDEKPRLSVFFICPQLTEEQADKGQLLFHLLA